jgi:hypothetical protein
MRMKAPQWSDVVRAIDDALAAFASNDAVAVELDFVQPRLLPTDQVLRFLTEARDDPFQPTARVSASQAVGLSRK